MIHKRLEKPIPVHQVLLHPLQLFLVKPVELRKLLERDLHEWPAKCLCCCNGNGYRRTEGNNLAPTVRFKADERAGTLTLIALDGIAFLEIALQRVDELAGLEANFRRRAVQLWALAAAPASGSGNNPCRCPHVPYRSLSRGSAAALEALSGAETEAGGFPMSLFSQRGSHCFSAKRFCAPSQPHGPGKTVSNKP